MVISERKQGKEGRDRCCQNVTRRQGNELLQDKEAEKEEEEEEEVHSGWRKRQREDNQKKKWKK